MTNTRYPLRLNVGFILHEEAGYSYEFSLDLPRIQLGEDLVLSQLAGSITVNRTAQGLLFTGTSSASTELTCVRCLKPFEQRLEWTLTELYALTEKSVSESGLLVPEDAQIDLEPLIRDYALLEVPIKPLCRPDCKGLCPVCGQDLNLRDCGHRRESDTSSLAALKDFL